MNEERWDGWRDDCRDCTTFDPMALHHYHCGNCGNGPTSMLGHYVRGEFTCIVQEASDDA